jgi:predicted metal-dependent peptidase
MPVVKVRVDAGLKKRLEEAGIDVPSEVRKHLEEFAWQAELKERLERLRKAFGDVPVVPKGTAARLVREDRDSH